jgi:glycerophosphoryl diester phosphodiesterase
MNSLRLAMASLVALVMLAGPAAAQDDAGLPPHAEGRLSLFVLAGQSNMSGRGEVPEDEAVARDVYVFGNDYRWRPGREPVDAADGQVDAVSIDGNAGFSPSIAFARALQKRYPGMKIGLIPCAKGATVIEQWQRSTSDETLYGSCLKRALAASPAGTIEGVLFLQGESDAHEGELYRGIRRYPTEWGRKFTTFVNDFRRDLGRDDLPIVFAQIGPHADPERYVNWEVVQEQQAQVRLPAVRMIETKDLALMDRVHFDTPSYRVIGRRFAGAMHSLLGDRRSYDLQGHRGARGLLPENALPGFRRALELGVTTLELDLGISRDALVIVSHEPWFSSSICLMPDGQPVLAGEEQSHNIYELTYAEIARYDCGSRGNPAFPEQVAMPATKPLLDSVIVHAEAYAALHGLPSVLYNMEIKSWPDRDGVFHPAPGPFARLVYDVIEAHGVTERTFIQSFDPRALEAMRTVDPTVRLVLLVDNNLGLETNLGGLTFTPAVYSPHHRLVDAELVEAVHRRGMKLIPWTVNDPGAMQRLVALGVDGIITDYPDRAP